MEKGSTQTGRPSTGMIVSVETCHVQPNALTGSTHNRHVYTDVVVLQSNKWDNPDTFNIDTRNPSHPVANISMKHVVNITTTGSELLTVPDDQLNRVVNISGSKDNVYQVSIKNGIPVSCTCKGFSFRRQCRHLTESMENIDDPCKSTNLE